MMLCGWWHNVFAQSEAGMEQYYYVENKAVIINPILWYQSNSGWCAEGRYNYEAAKTLSVYFGKTFENKSIISYTISTMLGAVIGKFKGGAVAINAEVEYKKYFFSLQSQYVFSIEDRRADFFYHWAELGYNTSSRFSVGLSLQQTNPYKIKSITEIGFFIKATHGNWTFPIYIYNPGSYESYSVVGLNYEWKNNKQLKDRKDQHNKKLKQIK